MRTAASYRTIESVPVAETDWRKRSLCTRESPDLFFPVGNGEGAQLQVQEAKRVCRDCEVREPCLSWALDAGVKDGVWGGLDEEERRGLLAQRQRRSRGTGSGRA